MLRASVTATGQQVNLRAVTDDVCDPVLEWGRQLRALTDAAVLRDEDERDIALGELVDVAGENAALRAAATAGCFEMMNRILDGTGVAPDPGFAEIAGELGVSWP